MGMVCRFHKQLLPLAGAPGTGQRAYEDGGDVKTPERKRIIYRGLYDEPSSRIGKRRRRPALGLLAVLLGGLLAIGVPALPAAAEPGVPADPVLLYEEDFENRATGSNMLLTDYTGASGMTYTGDPYWVSRPNCNGFIFDQTSAKDPADCTNDGLPDDSFNTATALAYALGVNAGAADPAHNAAATSYTASSGDDNAVMFQTNDLLSLAAANRFITFSVDAAAVNCFATHPQMQFYLLEEGGAEVPVSENAIDPCSDPRAQTMSVPAQDGQMREVAVGTFAADSSMLMTGDEFGIVLRNETGNGIGNDGAYDNIKVLDVSPQLDKSFSPELEFVGDVSTLTLTVTNTSELAAKSGWSFTDQLPAGLVVADAPGIGGSCTANVQAAGGATEIVVEDGQLASGEVSCTITVDVTSSTAGVYVNGPDNITDLVGLNPPEPATVEFVEAEPQLTLEKTADGDGAAVGETITYTFVATNSGNMPLTDVVISEGDFSGAGDLSALECDIAAPVALAPGEALTCTATYAVQQADVDAGGVTNTATATGNDPSGAPVPPVEDEDTVTFEQAPALALDKTADTDKVKAGDTITYTFTVENDGNVTVSDVQIEESEFSGAGDMSELECDTAIPATLAPGETLACTATYEVQQADAAAGEITNAALATGKDPAGGDVESPVSEAAVKVEAPPIDARDKNLTRTGMAMLPLAAAALVGCVIGLGLLLVSRQRREGHEIE